MAIKSALIGHSGTFIWNVCTTFVLLYFWFVLLFTLGKQWHVSTCKGTSCNVSGISTV